MQPLDFEKESQRTVTVRATEWLHSTQSQLIIKIGNLNDNYPIFEEKIYKIAIPEDSQENNFLRVKATDKDPFGELAYKIANSPLGLPFKINQKTGQISMQGTLDRETLDNYSFEVRYVIN